MYGQGWDVVYFGNIPAETCRNSTVLKILPCIRKTSKLERTERIALLPSNILSSGLLHHLSARSRPQDSSGYVQSLHYYATQLQRAASEDHNVVVSVGCSKDPRCRGGNGVEQ